MAKYGVADSYSSHRDPEDPEVRRAGDDLVEQPGLADPGLADHLDEDAVAGPRRLDGVEQRPQLGIATRHRQRGPIGLARADDRPDDRGANGLRLALRRERRRSGVVSNTVLERFRTISVERIWPASALAMTRAAVLIASPKTR